MNPAPPMLVEMRLCMHGCFPPSSSFPSLCLSFFVSLTLSLPPCRALSASLSLRARSSLPLRGRERAQLCPFQIRISDGDPAGFFAQRHPL